MRIGFIPFGALLMVFFFVYAFFCYPLPFVKILVNHHPHLFERLSMCKLKQMKTKKKKLL